MKENLKLSEKLSKQNTMEPGCRKMRSFPENWCAVGINRKGLRLKPIAVGLCPFDEIYWQAAEAAPAVDGVQIHQETSIFRQVSIQPASTGATHPSVAER